MVLVYAFAFFAKLNSSYFDPRFSCALVFYDNIRSLLPILPKIWLSSSFVIYLSLLVELLLAVTLAIPRFSAYAVTFGICIHFILSWDLVKYFTNFSAVMSVLLLLCMPTDFFKFMKNDQNKLLSKLSFLSIGFPSPARPRPCVFLILYILATAFAILESRKIAWAFPYSAVLIHILWLLFIVPILFALVRYRPSASKKSAPTLAVNPRKINLPAEGIVLLLVVVNGCAPYIGLKTRTAFNMYSNQRIEPAYSNHFLISRSLDWMSYLSDTAYIDSPDTLVCKDSLWSNTPYPYTEILRASEMCKEENIRIVREERQNSAIELNWFEKKLTLFRPLDLHSETECIW